MGVLDTAYIINDNVSNAPGALPLVGDVPAGAQLALILIRFDGNTATVSIDSLESSFGDVTILGQTSGYDSNCALAYVLVDAWGSGHTITPTTSGSFYFGQVYGLIFLDSVDVSRQSAWLRDFDLQWSNSVATATVDTREGDFVFGGISNWNQSPLTPAGCTSLIDPSGGFEIRQRVVQLDELPDDMTSFSSDDSYGAVAAISIIPVPAAILPVLFFGANF